MTPAITSAQKIAELERELRFRYDVYVRMANEGRMDPEVKDRRIAVIKAILDDYKAHGSTLDILNAPSDPSSRRSANRVPIDP